MWVARPLSENISSTISEISYPVRYVDLGHLYRTTVGSMHITLQSSIFNPNKYLCRPICQTSTNLLPLQPSWIYLIVHHADTDSQPSSSSLLISSDILLSLPLFWPLVFGSLDSLRPLPSLSSFSSAFSLPFRLVHLQTYLDLHFLSATSSEPVSNNSIVPDFFCRPQSGLCPLLVQCGEGKTVLSPLFQARLLLFP